MKLLGFASPRIAVCGLNPHAGEHGLFGDGRPARHSAGDSRRHARKASNAAARTPATPCFCRPSRGAYDLVVAMYHDQGHIPMKLIDFEGTVNVSLGIPIIRTSVDHGTAFDIAGKNQADAAQHEAGHAHGGHHGSHTAKAAGVGMLFLPHLANHAALVGHALACPGSGLLHCLRNDA